ncbi:MAG: hypothetical protein ACLUEQ_09215 [Cloacibacillus evryensis]
MADLRGSIYEIYSLEQLAGGCSAVHSLDPRVKIAGTLFYIAAVISFGRGELSGSRRFLYPAVALLADIPLAYSGGVAALPFASSRDILSVF